MSGRRNRKWNSPKAGKYLRDNMKFNIVEIKDVRGSAAGKMVS